MSKSESNISKEIMLAMSQLGCILWRNETFKAYAGKVTYKNADEVVIQNARFIAGGLCNGSSDLIGLAPDGRFLAIEVKSKSGRTSNEQKTFINAVINKGGIAFVARSANEAIEQLKANL